jgi:hypothetical protein
MMDSTILVLLLVLAFTLYGGDAQADSAHQIHNIDQVTLDSGRLRLNFDTSDGKLALRELSNDKGFQWVNPSAKPGPLWSITFVGPDGEKIEVVSNAVNISDIRKQTSAVAFTWDCPLVGKAAKVTMRIRTPKRDPLSYWSLKADLPDGWKVFTASFPMIPNIKMLDGLKLAAPVGWGIEYRIGPQTRYRAIYPSCSCSMQFVALYSEGKGLYIGMHDPQANHKVIDARSAGGGCFSYECENMPAIPASAEREYKVPSEAAIGVFDGDYFAAAQIYREFTFHTKWGKGLPIADRSIPKWLTDTDLWLRPARIPIQDVDLNECARAMEFFKVPTSIHWYYWHKIPFDTLYPDYFPAKDDFKAGVKALQQMGYHVIPYINGRLCDPNSTAWKNEDAGKWALRAEDGKPYTEIYASKVPLNSMCPYTGYWQRKIAGIVGTLFDDYGVDGVYVDQIGAAHALECFNPNHGHQIGGGHFWVDGYRKLLEETRKRVPKDHILTTEENTECWIDQFDALLMVNTPLSQNPPIPLFPAVYSGRSITFGAFYIQQEDIDQSLPFRMKIARQMLWGAQLGWFPIRGILDEGSMKEAEFVRDLARCRQFAHNYVTFGRFMGMMDVGGDNPRIVGSGPAYAGPYPIDTHSVLASKWLGADKTQGIVIVNISDTPHDIDLDISLSPKERVTLRCYDSAGLISPPQATEKGLHLNVRERSATLLTFSTEE